MSKSKVNAPLGASLVVGSSILYASYGIWTKLMGNSFGGYSASAARSVLVLAVILPLAAYAHQLSNWRWRQTWRFWAVSVGSGLFVWGPFYFAILKAGIGVAVAVNYASFIVSMFVLGWIFLGERFTKDKWVATALSLVGLYLIFTPNLSAGWLPLAAACLSGFGLAAGSIAIKSVPYPVMQSTVFLWAGSLVANAAMALAVHQHIPTIVWSAPWLYLLMFTAASIGASLMFIKGVKLIEAGAAGILGLLEIVFGVLFGAAFFGERTSPVALVGIGLIIGAAAIPYVKDYNAPRGTLEEPKTL